MAVTQTPRLGLTRWSAGTDPLTRAQIDDDHAALEELVAIDAQGTLAERPAFGVRGRYYFATDGVGRLFRDTGSAWVEVPVGTYVPSGGGTFTGPVLFATGTPAAPGIAFAGDPDTGLTGDGGGALDVALNAEHRYRFLPTLLRPAIDASPDLGASTFRWRRLYLSSNLHIDGSIVGGGVGVPLINYRDVRVNIAATSGNIVLDAAAGSFLNVGTLTGDATITVSPDFMAAGRIFTLRIADGGYAVTWPTEFRWTIDGPPDLSAGLQTIISGVVMNSATVYVAPVGTF